MSEFGSQGSDSSGSSNQSVDLDQLLEDLPLKLQSLIAVQQISEAGDMAKGVLIGTAQAEATEAAQQAEAAASGLGEDQSVSPVAKAAGLGEAAAEAARLAGELLSDITQVVEEEVHTEVASCSAGGGGESAASCTSKFSLMLAGLRGQAELHGQAMTTGDDDEESESSASTRVAIAKLLFKKSEDTIRVLIAFKEWAKPKLSRGVRVVYTAAAAAALGFGDFLRDYLPRIATQADRTRTTLLDFIEEIKKKVSTTLISPENSPVNSQNTNDTDDTNMSGITIGSVDQSNQTDLVVPAAFLEVLLMHYLSILIARFVEATNRRIRIAAEANIQHNETIEKMNREGLLEMFEQFARLIDSIENTRADVIIFSLNTLIDFTVGSAGQKIDPLLGQVIVKGRIRAFWSQLFDKLGKYTNITGGMRKLRDMVERINTSVENEAAAGDDGADVLVTQKALKALDALSTQIPIHDQWSSQLTTERVCSAGGGGSGGTCTLVLSARHDMVVNPLLPDDGMPPALSAQPVTLLPLPTRSRADDDRILSAKVQRRGGKRKTMKRKNSKTMKIKQRKSNKRKKTLRRRKTRK